MPKHEAEAYMDAQIAKYRNRLAYDTNTGTMQGKNLYMAIQEDLWFPKTKDTQWTIDTLEGGKQLDEIKDAQYFRDKLYKSLNLPSSRLGDDNKKFQIGKTDDTARDEVSFSKFIGQLRGQFSELFYDMLGTQLILKEIVTADWWDENKKYIKFIYRSDVHFAELKENTMLRERMEVYNLAKTLVKDGHWSNAKLKKDVLKISDEEAQKIKDERWREKYIEGEEEPTTSEDQQSSEYGGGFGDSSMGNLDNEPFDIGGEGGESQGGESTDTTSEELPSTEQSSTESSSSGEEIPNLPS